MTIEIEGDKESLEQARWQGGWGRTAQAAAEQDLPPLPDPYLSPGARREVEAPLSRAALTGFLVALTGPVGGPLAIWLGYSALAKTGGVRPAARGRALAIAALVIGALDVLCGSAALAIFLLYRSPSVQALDEPPPVASLEPPPAPAVAPTGSAGAGAKPPGSVPKDTTVARHGAVTLVDVGVNANTLREELANQRAEASKNRQKLVVMTYRDQCDPCADFVTAISDPLMQAALKDVRLVRVHVKVFKDDLKQLRIPYEEFPGFFLPSVDLTPRDGINGGEWDEDIAKNIAPVMSAFVQEKYKTRRRPWKPVAGGGIRL